MCAETMLGRSDMDGRAVWLRILKAIETLLDTQPGDGARVH